MRIQVNTDNHIAGREAFVIQVTEAVDGALDRFRDDITRVEVHVSDQNGKKSGPLDKRCKVEARVEGLPPTVATHDAETLMQAVDGAFDKVKRAIETTLDRRRDHRRGTA